MKTRGRRRERGLIRSVSFERLTARDESRELLGPVPQSRSIRGTGQRQRHVVTYRQASWPNTSPTLQTASTEDSLSIDLNQFDKESSIEPRAIQLTTTETGTYVSKPSSFCNVFEITYNPTTNVAEEQTFKTASAKLMFCPEQIEGNTGCGTFGVIGKILEESIDKWFSYPDVPFLKNVSSSESYSSKSDDSLPPPPPPPYPPPPLPVESRTRSRSGRKADRLKKKRVPRGRQMH